MITQIGLNCLLRRSSPKKENSVIIYSLLWVRSDPTIHSSWPTTALLFLPLTLPGDTVLVASWKNTLNLKKLIKPITWNLKTESALPKMFYLFRCIVNTWKLLIYIPHVVQSPVHDTFRYYLISHFVHIFYVAFFAFLNMLHEPHVEIKSSALCALNWFNVLVEAAINSELGFYLITFV